MVITTDLQHVLLEPGIERRWTCPCDHNWVATVWSVPWGAQPWPAMGRWLVDLAHHNGDCWGHPSIVVMVFMLLLNVCSVVLMFFFPWDIVGGILGHNFYLMFLFTWCFCLDGVRICFDCSVFMLGSNVALLVLTWFDVFCVCLRPDVESLCILYTVYIERDKEFEIKDMLEIFLRQYA